MKNSDSPNLNDVSHFSSSDCNQDVFICVQANYPHSNLGNKYFPDKKRSLMKNRIDQGLNNV